MLTFPLQYFPNDKNIFHINFTRSLTTSLLWRSMESFLKAKFSSMFNHLILDCAITCTQTRIHRTQSLHYDKSLKCSSLRHIVYNKLRCKIYHFALRDIVATKSRQHDISARYREDCTNISLIYRFNVRQSMRCFADISAINRENKVRYLSIIVCITFAQYCITRSYFCYADHI